MSAGGRLMACGLRTVDAHGAAEDDEIVLRAVDVQRGLSQAGDTGNELVNDQSTGRPSSRAICVRRVIFAFYTHDEFRIDLWHLIPCQFLSKIERLFFINSDGHD